MRSVADSLREQTRRHMLALPPGARIQRALALGDDDVKAMCDAKGITVDAARAVMARSRRLGRRPSSANAD
jgi:hypothetical protein